MADRTIDELARESGLSVRNIRSHTTRGLLPPPEVRGRTGYYGDEHLERLKLIQELQADGLSLGLVERLLVSQPETTTRIVALRRTLMGPLEPGEPLVLTLEQIVERFGPFDPEAIAKALELGALVPLPDGRFAAPIPGLLETAEQVMRHGVSLAAALTIGLKVRELSAEAARTFVEIVKHEVWDPFEEAGRPEDQWPQIAEAIDAVRPLAAQIFSQLLEPTIAAEIERVFGEELRELGEAD
ncbi:MAG: MerR family transcriptional regulator [Solirubrobacteraceae bacterium]|nr:MerR family transcriptional regulator [Solirubrobacteraceae bacterium]